MTTTPPVRWGFLGAGFIASRALAPAVHAADGAALVVAGSRDVHRAESLGPMRAVSSYDEVCTAEDVDVVYISLPNDAHSHWVQTALAAGKHVLCEKPLGMDADEVAAMTDAATRAGCLLVEGAWDRWHPRTQRAQALLAEAAGPRVARAWFTFPSVPADNYRLDPAHGGGALLDIGCYAVAAAHWALGAEDVTVVSAEQRMSSTGVDLTTTAVLAAGEGRAEVTASFERPESQGVEVEAPGLRVEIPDPAFTSWRTPSVLRVVEDGVTREEEFPACDAYQLMVEAMSARSRGQDAWLLPLSTSRAVATTLDEIVRRASDVSAS
jgi:predicted dehydrogenase